MIFDSAVPLGTMTTLGIPAAAAYAATEAAALPVEITARGRETQLLARLKYPRYCSGP